MFMILLILLMMIVVVVILMNMMLMVLFLVKYYDGDISAYICGVMCTFVALSAQIFLTPGCKSSAVHTYQKKKRAKNDYHDRND